MKITIWTAKVVRKDGSDEYNIIKPTEPEFLDAIILLYIGIVGADTAWAQSSQHHRNNKFLELWDEAGYYLRCNSIELEYDIADVEPSKEDIAYVKGFPPKIELRCQSCKKIYLQDVSEPGVCTNCGHLVYV